jgi:hypothetical protein
MISSTVIAYFLGFLMLGAFAAKIFWLWRKDKKNKVSKLLFYINAIFSLFMLVVAMGVLFFSKNVSILKVIEIISVLLQSFIFAIITYLVMFLRFPHFFPKIFSAVIFLIGLSAVFLTAFLPSNPGLDYTRSMNWDVNPVVKIIRTILFLVTFVPFIIVLIQEFKKSTDYLVRTRALGMILALVFGLVVAFFDFIFVTILHLGGIVSDMIVGTLSVIIFIVIFSSYKIKKI